MTVSDLLVLLAALNPEWYIMNAPRNPHQHRGSAGGLALVMPRAYMFEGNPSQKIGDVINSIKQGAEMYEVPLSGPVVAVEGMHQAGMTIQGVLLAPSGVRLVWDN